MYNYYGAMEINIAVEANIIARTQEKQRVVLTNKESIIDGYFWAVTEAKYLEGSAVPFGSNVMTPTLNNNKDNIKRS